MRIPWGKCVKIFERGTTGDAKIENLRGGKGRKTRLAKGYLGLQGSEDETGAMDESKEPLSSGEDVESNCRRNGTKSGDSIVQGV